MLTDNRGDVENLPRTSCGHCDELHLISVPVGGYRCVGLEREDEISHLHHSVSGSEWQPRDHGLTPYFTLGLDGSSGRLHRYSDSGAAVACIVDGGFFVSVLPCGDSPCCSFTRFGSYAQ